MRVEWATHHTCPFCADDPSGACQDCRAALDAEEAAERAEDARREGLS